MTYLFPLSFGSGRYPINDRGFGFLRFPLDWKTRGMVSKFRFLP